MIRDKERDFVVKKGSLYQEDIITLNVNGLYSRASKCMKQKLREVKGKI